MKTTINILILASLMCACSKPANEPGETKTTTNTIVSISLPTEVISYDASGNEAARGVYHYSGNRLQKISYTNGSEFRFTYTNDRTRTSKLYINGAAQDGHTVEDIDQYYNIIKQESFNKDGVKIASSSRGYKMVNL